MLNADRTGQRGESALSVADQQFLGLRGRIDVIDFLLLLFLRIDLQGFHRRQAFVEDLIGFSDVFFDVRQFHLQLLEFFDRRPVAERRSQLFDRFADLFTSSLGIVDQSFQLLMVDLRLSLDHLFAVRLC